MRIWIVNNYAIPPRFGGLVRHYYFSKYLRAKGHEVRILTSSQVHNTTYNFVEPGQLMKEVCFDSVPYVYVRTSAYTKNDARRIINMMQFSLRCKRAMEQLYQAGEHPDVIYASSPLPMSSKSAMTFAKKHGIPFLFEVRDLWPQSLVEYGHLQHKIYLKPVIAALYHLEHALYAGADRILFTMEGGSDYIYDKGWDDVDLTKCVHVNNGVDLDEFAHNLDTVHYEDKDLDDPHTFKVIYMGSIRPTYGLDRILEVAKRCKNEMQDVRFYFYGGGTELDRLRHRVQDEAITNVSFKGKVKKQEIPSILTRADVTLAHNRRMPITKYGTSNNKFFEYLASGATILSTVKSNHSLIRQYHLGVETEDQDVETILNAISRLRAMPEAERKATKERAETLAKNFDYRRLTDDLEKILIEMAGNR